MELDHTSHSAIEEYLKCPYRFYLNRVEKVDGVKWLAGPAGSAFHSMTEDYDNGLTVRPFNEYLFELVEYDTDYTYSRGEDFEWWERTGPIMFDAYRRWRDATGWEVEAVEEEFRIQPHGLRWPVVGYIDRRFRSPATGTAIICDIKTGYRLPVGSAQLPIYYVANLIRSSAEATGVHREAEGGAACTSRCDAGEGAEPNEQLHPSSGGGVVQRLHAEGDQGTDGSAGVQVAVNYYDARRGDSTGLEWPGWTEHNLVEYVSPVEEKIAADDWTPNPGPHCRYCPVRQHCEFKRGK